ncbi:hypothetical protein HRG34_12890, partial [Enterococcus faecalis]|nr:hypothetical protein [Enterococcus faecalis]
MRVHYAFPDKIIKYSCKSCNGLCCHVSNKILIDKETRIGISNEYDNIYNEFTTEINQEISLLHCGKTCWFLEQGEGCKLSLLGLKKPLTCSLYPLKITNYLNYVYVISFEPCPNFSVDITEKASNDQGTLITYKNSQEIITEYINKGSQVIEMKGEATISKKRIFEEINYQAELLDNFKNNEQKITIDRYKKFLYLYGQVRWNQKILRYPIKWSEEFIEMYCD